MLRLKSSDPDFGRAFTRLVKDRRESDENVARDVQTIIEDVRLRGDAALAEYTERFDNHLPGDDDWRITTEACRDAFDTLPPDLRAALEHIRILRALARFLQTCQPHRPVAAGHPQIV